MKKRIAALALVLVVLLGVPVRADFTDGITYNISNVWEFLSTGTSDWNWRDAVGSYTGDTWAEKYADFVDEVILSLKTDNIGSDGYVVPVTFQKPYTGHLKDYLSLESGPPVRFSYQTATNHSVYLIAESFTAPVSGIYSVYISMNGPSGFYRGKTGLVQGPSFVKAGDAFSVYQFVFSSSVESRVSFLIDCRLKIIPSGESVEAPGGVSGRPGNFNVKNQQNIKYGIQNEAGNVVVAEDVENLFLEQTMQYYNPVTNTYAPVNEWSYNYTDMKYSLEGVAGETVNIDYGDENVTMVITNSDGSTATYNYYYLVSEGGVSPSPSPGPGGSTGNSNSNNSNNSDSWFGDVVINIGDIIGNTLGGLGGGSGGEGGEGGEESGGGFFGWLGGKLGELLGAIGGGFLALIQEALGKVLDGLIYIVTMITEKLRTVVDTLLSVLDEIPGIFEGFTSFLEQVFSFFPPEIVTIITFGVSASDKM